MVGKRSGDCLVAFAVGLHSRQSALLSNEKESMSKRKMLSTHRLNTSLVGRSSFLSFLLLFTNVLSPPFYEIFSVIVCLNKEKNEKRKCQTLKKKLKKKVYARDSNIKEREKEKERERKLINKNKRSVSSFHYLFSLCVDFNSGSTKKILLKKFLTKKKKLSNILRIPYFFFNVLLNKSYKYNNSNPAY